MSDDRPRSHPLPHPGQLPSTFVQCVWTCWENVEFMREYRRLTGHTLGLEQRTALEAAIDQATGKPVINDVEARAFFDFVAKHVWLPLLFEHTEIGRVIG